MKKLLVLVPGLLIILFTLCAFPPLARADDSVCIQCHGGLEGRLGEPVGLWRSSVHAVNGISCHDCHGGDPTDFAMAMSPERGFIGAPDYAAVPEFCGRCHIGVKDDYLASAHGQKLETGGPQCVICHGNHRIQLASIELINQQSCSRCHDYERAAQVRKTIEATEATLTSLELSTAALHRLGIDVDRIKEQLFAQRNSFRRLFHTVNLGKIKAQTDAFDQDLSETKAQIADHEAVLGQRKLIGGAIVLLLLLGGCIALLIRKSYHDEE